MMPTIIPMNGINKTTNKITTNVIKRKELNDYIKYENEDRKATSDNCGTCGDFNFSNDVSERKKLLARVQ